MKGKLVSAGLNTPHCTVEFAAKQTILRRHQLEICLASLRGTVQLVEVSYKLGRYRMTTFYFHSCISFIYDKMLSTRNICTLNN
jgi:hypothetical protein